MILSPPFLPIFDRDLMDIAAPDPLMDAVDGYELPHHGIYPIDITPKITVNSYSGPLDMIRISWAKMLFPHVSQVDFIGCRNNFL